MTNSNQIDIIKEILLKTIEEFANTSEKYKGSAATLKSGIEDGKYVDYQWVMSALDEKLDTNTDKDGEDENKAD